MCSALFVVWVVLIARVILSWVGHLVPEPLRPVTRLVFAVTEPVLKRVRPLMPPLQIGMAALDLSILLVFLLLSVLMSSVC